MRKFDGIIFDIDGTLTSTNQLIYDSFNFILNKHQNKILTPAEIISFFGPTEDQLIEDWFPDKHEEVKTDYYSYYSENHGIAGLYPGIKELLDEIKEHGIKLSVFTGKGRSAAMITLEKLDIAKYFDEIVTGSDVVNHKPSPEGIIKFIDRFRLSKDRVIMIGDAMADLKAAHGAGIRVVSVLWDSYGKDEILNSGSDLLAHSVPELRKILLG